MYWGLCRYLILLFVLQKIIWPVQIRIKCQNCIFVAVPVLEQPSWMRKIFLSHLWKIIRNLPTFIMDGFEISVQKLYDMDPSRIESITILKDAAATAMYGSRAANGVVIITTVTPKPGKINVNYNFTGTLSIRI